MTAPDSQPNSGHSSPRASRQELAAELAVHRTELEMQNHELRDAQHKLELSRARYFSLFDLSPVPYLVLSEDFLVAEANLAAGGLLQLDRSRLLAQPIHRFAGEDVRETWLVQLHRGFNELRPTTFDSVIKGNDGTFIHVHIVCQPMCAEAAQKERFLLVALFDITPRIEAERERQRLSQKLLETQKLESLGILAGGIAHDFNNILTGVLTAASLLKDEVRHMPNALSLTELIEKSGRRMADLCKQLLAYAGKGRLTMAPLRVNPLASDLLSLLSASLPKKHRLIFTPATYVPAVIGDATQLRQVVMNLVVNASEAIGEGDGEISIRTGVENIVPKALTGVATGADLPPGNYVYIEVADTGCGMSHATLARIFDPFFTTKFTGRGLGLAAVLGIMRSHKGLLMVHSEQHRGTCFRFWLPVADAGVDLPEAEEPVAPVRRRTIEGGTVMIIDDEPIVRHVLEDLLKYQKCHPILAESGQDAVRLLKQLDEAPDLILLDLTMPGWDGPQTFTALREAGYQGPIFLMSGYAAEDISDRTAHLDIAGFIQKPILLPELLERIKPAIRQR